VELKDLLQIASNFGFAGLVAIYVLWRIAPILARLVAIEAAELELMRISYEKQLGQEPVKQVMKKHGIDDE
jgi:hypothetical protein